MPNIFATAPFAYPGAQWAEKAQFKNLGIELFPADVRALNSSPVAFIQAPLPEQLIIPVQTVTVGKLGTSAYSAAPAPRLQYSDGTLPVALLVGAWDGTAASIASLSYQIAVDGNDLESKLGLGMEIASAADVTGGDAVCTVLYFYLLASLKGLL